MIARGCLLLAAGALVGCATPKGEGHLLERLAVAKPDKWPTPTPVQQGGGVEITEGALTDAEARPLGTACSSAVDDVVRARGATVRSEGEGWRVQVAHVGIDVQTSGRGERMVRARVVVEVRQRGAMLSSAVGTAILVASSPTLHRGPAVASEVEKTVVHACQDAARALMQPGVALTPQRRETLHADLRGMDVLKKTQAAQELGKALDEESAPALLACLGDADATVRRLCAWGLGQLTYVPAADPLAFLVETDGDYGVRTESLAALEKMVRVDEGVRPVIRAARQRGREAREKALQAEPGESQEPETPTRVVPDG